jgi:hypothetical protein
MMGHQQVEQAALFYEFSLERYVPADHLLRSPTSSASSRSTGCGSADRPARAMSSSSPSPPKTSANWQS